MNGLFLNDCVYVGILLIGLYSYIIVFGYEFSYGVDLIVIGFSIGMIDLQEFFYDVFSVLLVGLNVCDNQLGDVFYLVLIVEIGCMVEIGEDVMFCLFVEVQFGFEDMVWIGVDFQFGLFGFDLICGCDVVIGQCYNLGELDYVGYLIFVGVDYVWVLDSVLFLVSFGIEVMDMCYCVCVGVNWQLGD